MLIVRNGKKTQNLQKIEKNNPPVVFGNAREGTTLMVFHGRYELLWPIVGTQLDPSVCRLPMGERGITSTFPHLSGLARQGGAER